MSRVKIYFDFEGILVAVSWVLVKKALYVCKYTGRQYIHIKRIVIR